MSPRLEDRIRSVVETGCCSGCGACTRLDENVTMSLSDDGYLRPVWTGPSSAGRAEVRRFDRACPGRRVRAQRPAGTTRHPLLGPVAGAWRASATDLETRFTGSSGGVLTALQAWLVESGEVSQAVGAAGAADPRRTVSVTITSRADALAAAGSRYAPVATCAHPEAASPSSVTVGKPCEVSALRADATGSETPLLLSFFCAGTPSAHATDALVGELGLPPATRLSALWYRGRGWPGRFTARAADGAEVSTSYNESWGHALGPSMQWRCKICPDGIAESADITAGDLWNADARGYPTFTEADGVSALIARTPRGLDVVLRAIEAGVISAEPVALASIVGAQPAQSKRRTTLAGRLTGLRLAGGHAPRYRGFGLLALAARALRTNVRTARGTFRRVRAGAAHEPRPES